MTKHIDIVFDGPPGPEAGRFENGESIRFGEWLQRQDGYWVLRFLDMLTELKRLHEKTGWQSTADIIAAAEGPALPPQQGSGEAEQ